MDNLDFVDGGDAMDGMDDLFFDNAMQAHAQEVRGSSLPPELLYRIDELIGSGCSQRIAWSRLGCIAYISADCKAVRFRTFPLESNTKTRSLDLSNFHSRGNELVHLCWDALGVCLAFADIAGHVSIHRVDSYTINKFRPMGKFAPNKPDMCNRLVGMHWIGCRTAEMRVCPRAIRNGTRWEYPAIPSGPKGPLHPVPDRDALLFITRDATVHMMTGQYRLHPLTQDLYQHTETILSAPATTTQLLSHASFAPYDDNQLLIFTLDFEYCISAFLLRVDWNAPNKEQNPLIASLLPTMRVTYLTSTTFRSDTGQINSLHMPAITHLQALPPAEPPLTEKRTPACVILTCTMSDGSSRLLTYKLESGLDKLDDSFQFLNVPLSKVDLGQPSYELRQHDEVELSSFCIGLRPIRSYTTLWFCEDNGNMLGRHRDDLALANARSLDHSSMIDLGRATVINLGCSPNACAALSLTYDGEDDIEDSEQFDTKFADIIDVQDDNLAADLATSFASASFADQTQDDILAFIEHIKSVRSIDIANVLREFHIAARVSDMRLYTETMLVLVNGGVQRSLSAQYQLLKHSSDTLASARLAWLMMDMLYLCRAFSKAYETFKTPDSLQSELPTQLCSLILWYNRTSTYLISEILRISRCSQEDMLGVCTNSPGIRFLLSYWGRPLLSFAQANLHKILTARKHSMDNRSQLSIKTYQGWLEFGTTDHN